MNAYELADELQKLDARLHLINLFKSADMLRQQADRIAELEKDGKVCATCGGLVYDPVLKQTKPAPEGLIDPKSYYIGYADGKKAPQTKPENVWTFCVACGQKITADSIHTCSPQTKPLSDEEITDVFVTCLLPDGEFDEHEFARAIEERHGIK